MAHNSGASRRTASCSALEAVVSTASTQPVRSATKSSLLMRGRCYQLDTASPCIRSQRWKRYRISRAQNMGSCAIPLGRRRPTFPVGAVRTIQVHTAHTLALGPVALTTPTSTPDPIHFGQCVRISRRRLPGTQFHENNTDRNAKKFPPSLITKNAETSGIDPEMHMPKEREDQLYPKTKRRQQFQRKGISNSLNRELIMTGRS